MVKKNERLYHYEEEFGFGVFEIFAILTDGYFASWVFIEVFSYIGYIDLSHASANALKSHDIFYSHYTSL